ncbi:MAG: hypothetical protein PHR44_00970 [Candidatus Omnitrophica bacterium]|nr:hypothetical protein [Candidatus Omnitrophota bacterium]
MKILSVSVLMIMLTAVVGPVYAQEESIELEIINPEYMKSPDESDNVEIGEEATIEDILKKVNYYYANRDFDKAIELAEAAVKATDDPDIIAMLSFSLSSNYLEKGIEPYKQNKDDTFYKLSIEYAKKVLEQMSYNWQALGNIGSAYLNMGDYAQAASYFAQAEKYLDETDPNYASIQYHRKVAEEMQKSSTVPLP